MLPGGIAAAAFLLSLIPGWWFLRRTESHRRPRDLSALQELLELVAVGVITTGIAAAGGLLLWPGLVLDHNWPDNTPWEIRHDVLLVLGTMAAALGFAEVAAWQFRRRNPAPDSEFTIGVWWSVLRADKVPKGQLSYVSLALRDGSTVEGVLADYTWAPDVAHRDIALKGKIKFTQQSPTRPWRRVTIVKKTTPYDRLIVPESEIKHIAMKYVDKGRSSRAT